jgi:pyruvate,water dikinase
MYLQASWMALAMHLGRPQCRDPARRLEAGHQVPRSAVDVTHRWIVVAASATDASLCGGKGVGLARLEHAGLAVPAAICVTTDFYRDWLAASGMGVHLAQVMADPGIRDPELRRNILSKTRARIETAATPPEVAAAFTEAVARLRAGWNGDLAVRSSAPYEDERDASHAGIHESFVVDDPDVGAVFAAVKACWSSLWTESAWTYRERQGIAHADAAMAVVIQRFIAAERSGVAFSADPLTGDRTTIVVEAGWGTGAALVAGRLTPDEYRVTMEGDGPARVRRRAGRQQEMTTWRGGRQVAVPVPETRRRQPVLGEAEALEIARLAKAAERALRAPADIEWVADGAALWVVQARPITTLAAPAPPQRETVWTRANLKEILPELPSPLALSYLSAAMNRMFAAYHGSQGHPLPPGTRFVSVFRGRPYLNLTLMQEMTTARGGDPALVIRLFGGAEAAGPSGASPKVPTGGDRVPLAREMLATFFRTPARGQRLFRRIRRQAAALRAVALDRLDDRALQAHLEQFQARLLDEATVRRLHEVVSAQSRAYMALERLLAAWISTDPEALVKRLMTGLGTLPNARMTYRIMALGAAAAGEASARAFFAGDLDAAAVAGHRAALAGSRFLDALDEFLEEFGHRGRHESDVMSPRFADDPLPLLRLIQLHVRARTHEDPARHAAERQLVRRAAREEARRELRRGRGRLAFGVRWLAFSIVCRALQRLLALRDECRHVTTLLVAHLRRLTLELGRRAALDGRLASDADVFFLTWDELPRLLQERAPDWRGLALARRAERDAHARLPAPVLLGGAPKAGGDGPETRDVLSGLGVSPGLVTGTVKVLRSVEDAADLSGEIGVFPTIEPTLTPLFPLLRGMIAEMGGLLSHAAILAREYGLPAVVNVPDATRRLRDGDRVEVDGTTGRIRLLERRPG